MAPPDRLLALSVEGLLPLSAQLAAIEACPRIVRRVPEEAYATGVVVAFKDQAAYILSAHHATNGSNRQFQFFTADSIASPALTVSTASRIVMTEVTADVVLYKVPWPEGVSWKPTVLPLARPGQRPKRFPFPAMSIGCSEGRPPSAINETIEAKRLGTKTDKDLAFVWQAKEPPKQGRSGGPLLNSKGEVIGLCAASKDNLGYYVHLDEIQVALQVAGYDWIWK